MTDELRVPSARECMAEAYRELLMVDGGAERAAVWLGMARELREEAMMRRMWTPLPEPVPAARQMTLHDIAGVVCAHGYVAVQWKDSDDSLGREWWTHVDGTNCDKPDVEHEWFRRRSEQAAPEDPPTEVLDAGQRMEDEPVEDDEDDGSGYFRDLERNDTAITRPYVDEPAWKRATQKHPLDATAVLPPVLPAPPVEGAVGVCRKHDEANDLVVHGGRWVHVATGQAVCPIPGRTPEGDETYHRFADPL